MAKTLMDLFDLESPDRQKLVLHQRYFGRLPKGRLPSLNEIITMHYRTYTKLKKEAYRVIVAVSRRYLRPVEFFPIQIHFHWYAKNRKIDPDNISAAGRKLILDGLQQAGILPNDGWNQFIEKEGEVIPFQDFFSVDKDNPRIEVDIYPAEDDYHVKFDSKP